MAKLTNQEIELIRSSISDRSKTPDNVLLATLRAVLSGGIQNVDPELIRVFADEINARGIRADMLGESRRRRRTPMKITKLQLKRIIREEKQKLLNEVQGFIEDKELKEAVYATFCEWCAEDGDWSIFEEGVARRYSTLIGEIVSVADLQLTCQDIVDGIISESTMKIKVTKPDNPWMHDHYEVDENLAQEIADELADACEGYEYGASYNYNRHVEPVLQKYLAEIEDMGQQRATVRAVELKLNKMSDYRDFHQGANAARKCVQSFEAYMTPGFSKARRISDYGYDPTDR